MRPTGYFFVELTGEFAQWNPYQNEVGKNCKSYRLRYAGLKFFCAAVGDRAQDDVILIASSAALFWKTPKTALEK